VRGAFHFLFFKPLSVGQKMQRLASSLLEAALV
jgi:hypothetical protein